MRPGPARTRRWRRRAAVRAWSAVLCSPAPPRRTGRRAYDGPTTCQTSGPRGRRRCAPRRPRCPHGADRPVAARYPPGRTADAGHRHDPRRPRGVVRRQLRRVGRRSCVHGRPPNGTDHRRAVDRPRRPNAAAHPGRRPGRSGAQAGRRGGTARWTHPRGCRSAYRSRAGRLRARCHGRPGGHRLRARCRRRDRRCVDRRRGDRRCRGHLDGRCHASRCSGRRASRCLRGGGGRRSHGCHDHHDGDGHPAGHRCGRRGADVRPARRCHRGRPDGRRHASWCSGRRASRCLHGGGDRHASHHHCRRDPADRSRHASRCRLGRHAEARPRASCRHRGWSRCRVNRRRHGHRASHHHCGWDRCRVNRRRHGHRASHHHCGWGRCRASRRGRRAGGRLRASYRHCDWDRCRASRRDRRGEVRLRASRCPRGGGRRSANRCRRRGHRGGAGRPLRYHQRGRRGGGGRRASRCLRAADRCRCAAHVGRRRGSTCRACYRHGGRSHRCLASRRGRRHCGQVGRRGRVAIRHASRRCDRATTAAPNAHRPAQRRGTSSRVRRHGYRYRVDPRRGCRRTDRPRVDHRPGLPGRDHLPSNGFGRHCRHADARLRDRSHPPYSLHKDTNLRAGAAGARQRPPACGRENGGEANASPPLFRV